jgi:hypothetical protein
MEGLFSGEHVTGVEGRDGRVGPVDHDTIISGSPESQAA